MNILVRWLYIITGTLTLVAVLAGIAIWLAYTHYSKGLPDYSQLANYDPPVVTRVHASDGRLLAEFATENRVFVPIRAIPKRVINAFLSAEDKNFYTHPGIDIAGVFRAVMHNITALGSDRRPAGASTITQQVTKNFLLTNEVSIARKIREAILSIRIEKAFTKDRILELYLNQIYLGSGNYGVASAALNYFDKSLDELSVAEAAYLAALPKAPNNYSVRRNPEAAKARRDWVIDRMQEDGHITAEIAAAEKNIPLTLAKRGPDEQVTAEFFAEEVRREIAKQFGEKGLYERGLTVRTTLDPKLQEIVDRVFRKHLVAFDRTQGYGGPLLKISSLVDWQTSLNSLPPMPYLYEWQRAMVLDVEKDKAIIGLSDETRGEIPLKELTWARKRQADHSLGPTIQSATDVLQAGDIIAVEPLAKDANGKDYPAHTFTLRQIPEISGAMAVLDPHTGRVLAINGGWSYKLSEFNRATQAYRQPGSSFKPIVYLTALENGATPSTLVLDAPIVINQGPGLPPWRPENYKQEYYGPSTLRLGLEKSRNLMTVRLAQSVGMNKVSEMASRLGAIDDMKPQLAMSLGAGETTVLRMAAAYGMIVNGGKKIIPSFIDRIQDNNGWTIYRHDQRVCEKCQGLNYHESDLPPFIPDDRMQVLDPANAYQMVSMLEGVVQRGTGTAVKAVGKPLAGKTGTTNESKETWFVGFSPDLVAAIYLGYDQPRTMGKRATGGGLSAPIFRDFMIEALANKPAIPFRVPSGVRLVRVAYKTGLRAKPGDDPVIWEAYKPGTEPGDYANVAIIEGNSNFGQDAGYGSVIPIEGVNGVNPDGTSDAPPSGDSLAPGETGFSPFAPGTLNPSGGAISNEGIY